MIHKVSLRNIAIWGWRDDFLCQANFTFGSLQLKYVEYIKVLLLPEKGGLLFEIR